MNENPAMARRGGSPPARSGPLARAALACGIAQLVLVVLIVGMLSLLFVVEFTLAGQRAVSDGAVAGMLVVCTVLAAVPVILGWAAGRQIRREGGPVTGAAKTAIILGCVSAGMTVLAFLVLGLARASG